MTVEEMMTMIDKKVESDNEKKIAENKRIERRKEECKQKIRDLQPRIVNAIKLCNYATSKGIKLTNTGFGCHEGYDTGFFFSNSWSHLVGFINSGSYEMPFTNEMGIIKGGACGYIDFHTDGNDIYGFDTSIKKPVEPLLCDMERFVKAFDDFENALFEFIKKSCE